MRSHPKLLILFPAVAALCVVAVVSCGGADVPQDAGPAIERPVVIWKVGSPNEDSMLSAAVPRRFAEELEQVGKTLTVKTSTANEFPYELAESFRQGDPPDLVAGDNWIPFEPLFEEPSLEGEMLMVNGAFEEVGGIAFVFRSSPNFSVVRDMVLAPTPCNDPIGSAVVPDAESAGVYEEIGRAHLSASEDLMRDHSDPDRLPIELPDDADAGSTTVDVSGFEACQQWGNERLSFVHAHASLEGPTFLVRNDLLMVLRRQDGPWQLLTAVSGDSVRGEELDALWNLGESLATARSTGQAARPAILLEPDDGQYPGRGSSLGDRYGAFVWSPSPSSNVVAEIGEFVLWRDTRLFVRLRSDPQAEPRVSSGRLYGGGDTPWRWRVWSITDDGFITFTETRSTGSTASSSSPAEADAAPAPPTISGLVTTADTGEPLPRAQVGARLIRGEMVDAEILTYLPLGPAERMPSLFGMGGLGNTLATDPWGRYVLGRGFQSTPWDPEEHMPPGTIVELVAWEPGYCPQEHGERLEFVEGEVIEGVDFRLEPGCSISGRVLADDTGEPLAGAHVRFELAPNPLIGLQQALAGGDPIPIFWMPTMLEQQATTDAEGRFSLPVPMGALPPGTHLAGISVSQPGYAEKSHEGLPVGLQLDAPHTLDDIEIRLEPITAAGRVVEVVLPRRSDPRRDATGSISGRLLDDLGVPLPPPAPPRQGVGVPAHVIAFHRRYEESHWQWSEVKTAPLDADGYYQLTGLPPGDYILASRIRPAAFTEIGRRFADSTDTYAWTLYPGTPNLSEAQRVTVSAGENLAGVDFALLRVPTVEVSGIVLGSDGKPVQEGTVTAFRADSPYGGAGAAKIERDGSFRFSDRFVAGVYTFWASRGSGAAWGPAEAGTMTAEIPSSGAEELTITTRRGAVIPGRVVVDGGEAGFDLSVLQLVAVHMLAPERLRMPAGTTHSRATVEADGRFEFRYVFTPRVLRFTHLPDGWVLKAVILDGRDITDTPVDFQSLEPPGEVQVVIAPVVAGVSGSVVGVGNEKLRTLRVVLFAEDRSHWGHATEQGASRFVKLARLDREGRFQIVAPAGTYQIAAIDDEAAWSAPETLEMLQARGAHIELEDGIVEEIVLSVKSGPGS